MAGVTLADGLKVAVNVLASRRRPMLAHLVVTRYCNLDCAYCSEYDKVSQPVPLDELLARVDALARLGTQIVTLTGGEPLTHPGHDAVIARIREHGMVATTITNGFLLTVEKINGMNAAGLQEMQISIDGVKPDAVSKKTLKSLAGKLELLAQHAAFHVNINSVLGISEERTQDAIEVAQAAKDWGFQPYGGRASRRRGHPGAAVGHPAKGLRRPDGQAIVRASDQLPDVPEEPDGRPSRTAGAAARAPATFTSARTAWCTIARSSAANPARRCCSTAWPTSCANTTPPSRARPYCTVSCVHQASFLDAFRSPQRAAAAA